MFNKDKRKANKQQIEDDSISIFDSEEEGKKHGNKVKNPDQLTKKRKNKRQKVKIEQKKKRRSNLKIRQKELNLAQLQIMKKLMVPQIQKEQMNLTEQKQNNSFSPIENKQQQQKNRQINMVDDDEYICKDQKIQDNCIIEGGQDQVNLQEIYVEDGFMDYQQTYNRDQYQEHPYLQGHYYDYAMPTPLPNQTNQQYHQPYHPTNNQPYNQPNNQPDNQSNSQPNNQPYNQPNNQQNNPSQSYNNPYSNPYHQHHNYPQHNKYWLYQQKMTVHHHNSNKYQLIGQQKHGYDATMINENRKMKIKRAYARITRLKRQFNQLQNDNSQCNSKLIESLNEQQKNDKLSIIEQQLQLIQSILQQKPYIYISQIIELLNCNNNNLNITDQILYQLIRMSNYIKKPLQTIKNDNKNTQQSIQARYQYSLALSQHRNHHYKVIYYDEMILHQFYHRNNVWCRKIGRRREFYDDDINASLVIAAFMWQEDKVCCWKIKFGGFTFYEQLQNIKKQLDRFQNNKNLLIYNRSTHNIQNMTQQLPHKDLKILKLGCPNSELNPVTSCFDKIKAQLVNPIFDNCTTLQQKAIKILQNINKDKLGYKYLQEIQNNIVRSFKKQYF